MKESERRKQDKREEETHKEKRNEIKRGSETGTKKQINGSLFLAC